MGYSVYYYAKNMYSVPGLRLMAVDGVVPSEETIANGSYPFLNEFYAVIRKNEPGGWQRPQTAGLGAVGGGPPGDQGCRLCRPAFLIPWPDKS